MLFSCINSLGAYTLYIFESIGAFVQFLLIAVKNLFFKKLKLRKTLAQMEQIGINSLVIVILTGTFAGAVLVVQLYIGFKQFSAQEFIGPVVAFCMARELGPVLTGLMVTGRAGSAITAEIGTMRITEQIDALRALRINVWQYLIVPRIVASTIILPFLTLFTITCGIVGGYIIAVYALNLHGEIYISNIKKYLEVSDVVCGLIKSSVFGLILSWVGCYKGYYTSGGSHGVGTSTTQSVVIGSIMIIIANYFLTILLFE